MVRGGRFRRCFSSAIRCPAVSHLSRQISIWWPVSWGVAFERDSAAGFGLEDVAIFGGDGVDAEVPNTEIDRFV